MTEHTHQNRLCADENCTKEVIETDSGLVHEGGGQILQSCRNCGWTGGQVERFIQCPRCGDQTALLDDHVAS